MIVNFVGKTSNGIAKVSSAEFTIFAKEEFI